MSLGALNSDARAMLAQTRMDLNQCRMLQAELITEAQELTAQGVLDDASQQAVEVAIDYARQLGQRHTEQQRQMNRDALDDAARDMQQGITNGFHPRLLGMPRMEKGSGGNWRSPLPSLPGRGTAVLGQTMAALFGPPRERSRWDDASQFFEAVASGRHHPYLQTYTAQMNEGSGPGGGFLVPIEIAYEVLDEALSLEVVRPRATVVPMLSRTKLVPSYDGTDQSALANLYGFEFRWLEENQEVEPGAGLVRALELTARLGGIYLRASNELSQDAPEFASNLTSRLIVAIAENMDQSFLIGDGIAKPLGVLKSSARLTVAKETTQQAGTILWKNLTKMFSVSTTPSLSVWVVNPSTLPQLLEMTVTVGTGGSVIPAVQIGPDGRMTMLTRPLLTSPKMPVLGKEGDVLLADFSAYYIGLRKEVGIEASGHVGFTSNSTVWRGLVRVDGQPKVSSPYLGPDGLSYSPFVTLGPRP